SRWGWLDFASSYELAFLLELERLPAVQTVNRGPIIPYELDGVTREFFLDYEVVWASGSRWWCEVKSSYVGRRRDRFEKLKAKLAAALRYARQGHADRVVLVTEKSAPELFGFRMPRGNRHMLFRQHANKI